MSGPKCSHVRVRNNVDLEAARLAAARRVADNAGTALSAALAKLDDGGKDHGLARPSPNSAAALEAYAAAANQRRIQAENEIAIRAAWARADAVIADAKVEGWTPPARGQAASREPDARALATAKARADLAHRLLARLPVSAGDEIAKRVRSLAAALAACEEEARAKRLEDEIRRDVQHATDRDRQLETSAQRADALLPALFGLAGGEVEEVRAQLERALLREEFLPAGYEEKVDQARAAAVRRADSAYASRVIREELARLGCDVEEGGFATAFAAGERAVVPLPTNGEFGMELRMDPATQMLEIEAVRFAESSEDAVADPAVDRQGETDFCQIWFRVRAAAEARGLGVGQFRARPIGERAVKVVAGKVRRDHGTEARVRRRPAAAARRIE